MNALAAPGVKLGDTYLMLHPMRNMSYHPKTACLNVKRIHGWRSLARNALGFEVVYESEASGEAISLKHQLIRQLDGVWLVGAPFY